jgi:hypothetical protein
MRKRVPWFAALFALLFVGWVLTDAHVLEHLAVVAPITIGLVLYFLPSMLSIARDKRNAPAIFVLNLLLGWTLIGWAGALIWAVTKDAPSPAVTTA